MSIAAVGTIASIVILATAIIDWWRGKTGLGKHRLTKEHTPDRYWMTIVLYINLALLMFWLSGKAFNAEAEAVMRGLEEGGVIIFTSEEQE